MVHPFTRPEFARLRLDHAIAACARRQRGVISSAQLGDPGVKSRAVSHCA